MPALSEKTKIILPIIGSTVAILVFLLVAWPTHPGKAGQKGKTTHNSQTTGKKRDDSRGAGWRDDASGDRQEQRGSATNQRGNRQNQVSGNETATARPKGETWWYQNKGSQSDKETNEGWWYRD